VVPGKSRFRELPPAAPGASDLSEAIVCGSIAMSYGGQLRGTGNNYGKPGDGLLVGQRSYEGHRVGKLAIIPFSPARIIW
jgi:hypothetical protein